MKINNLLLDKIVFKIYSNNQRETNEISINDLLG
jgi:hypothetical protein